MVNRKLGKLVILIIVAATLLVPCTVHAIAKVGQSLPAFSVSTSSGQRVTNQNYSGRVLLLVFSTEYCSACKKAVPGIDMLADRYGRQEFHALGLFSGSGLDNDDLKLYMKMYGVTYPMALVEQSLAVDQFGVISVPFSLLVNRKGVVAGVYYGYSEGIMKQIEEQVKKLLAE